MQWWDVLFYLYGIRHRDDPHSVFVFQNAQHGFIDTLLAEGARLYGIDHIRDLLFKIGAAKQIVACLDSTDADGLRRI